MRPADLRILALVRRGVYLLRGKGRVGAGKSLGPTDLEGARLLELESAGAVIRRRSSPSSLGGGNGVEVCRRTSSGLIRVRSWRRGIGQVKTDESSVQPQAM